MNTKSVCTPVFRWVPVLLLAFLLAGCATRRIDWNARVGNYTYDQAIVEMGPPDKSAKLTDGTIVAEWLTYRSAPTTYFRPYPLYSRHYLYPYPGFSYVESYPSYESFVRLTFGPDGVLKAWQRFSR